MSCVQLHLNRIVCLKCYLNYCW